MSKKLHAKDLRRDEVVEAVSHAGEATYEFSREHRSGLLYGGIAVLAVALIGIVVAWRVDVSRRAGLQAYAEATKTWRQASGDLPMDEGATKPTWDEVATKLGAVAEEHGGTASGRLAAMQQGLALLRAGKPQDAAPLLDAFVAKNPSHWATPDALAALAAAREDAGDAAGAEAALTKLRDGKWRAWPNGAAQVLLAQLYERQGRTADARAVYESLTKDEKLKDTTWGSQATSRLAELSPAPAAS